MPPGFGLLDAALFSVPVFLTFLGLIRGAPVELASCCGCAAGIVVTWFVSCLPPVQALGQPVAPLLALLSGLVAWRIMRGLSKRFGFDTRWVEFGRIFDAFAGAVMGGTRGVAFVAAGCLSYAMIAVPLGLANPMRTVAYPVFLAVGSRVTSAAIEAAEPVRAEIAQATPAQSLATVPLPFVAPQIGTPDSGARAGARERPGAGRADPCHRAVGRRRPRSATRGARDGVPPGHPGPRHTRETDGDASQYPAPHGNAAPPRPSLSRPPRLPLAVARGRVIYRLMREGPVEGCR